MHTTKREKEPKTCHDCGLEAIDECESGKGHIPFDEHRAPCKFCERNYGTEDIMTDFYSENWTLDDKGKPMFDDPTMRDRALLRLLKYAEQFFGE